MKPLVRSLGLSAGALALTLAFAAFQRLTGPTHPLRGRLDVGGCAVAYHLPRSEDSVRAAVVRLQDPGRESAAVLLYRRFPTADPLQTVPFERQGDALRAELPAAPPAGKLEYQVRVQCRGQTRVVPENAAVIRFKGAVPAGVLVPHILSIFLGLLFASRCALGALGGPPRRRDALLALAGLVLGGLVLGPIVQKYAFGAFWTGFPLGSDLTDNKTLAAVLAWAVACLFMRRPGPAARWAAWIGWAVVLIAFGIPHSLYGSQLDWNTVP